MALARARLHALSIAGLAVTSMVDCRGPTSVRITTYSEIECARNARVALVVARDTAGLRDVAPAAFSMSCAPAAPPFAGQYETGAVVVAPAADKDTSFAVALMTRPDGESPESCIDPKEARNCIVARRQLHYSPHDETTLAVELRLSCLGVVCPSDQTCRKGVCVDAHVPTGCVGCAEEALAKSSAPACGDMRGLQAGAPWPMPGFCPTRPGRSGRNGPRTSNVKWSFPLGGIASMSPTVAADGTIYAGSNARTAYAIHPDGSEKWRANVGGNINGSGFVIGPDGTVFVGVADGQVYAFGPDGARKWATPIGVDVAFSPVPGGDGTLYAVSIDVGAPQPVIALAPSDGSIKWKSSATFGTGALAVATDGTLLASGTDRTLHALRPRDGTSVWDAPTGQPPRSPSIGDDGTIYVVADQKLNAFTPAGQKKWEVPLEGETVGVALGPDAVYVAMQNQKLRAVALDGSVRWTLAAGKGWSKPGVVGGDGTFYIGNDDGNVYAVSSDGKVRWTATVGGSLISQPALGADGTLYIVSASGSLFAIGP